MDDVDLEELRSELDDFAGPAKSDGRSAKDQRIIAGFEEIERFVEGHGRVPEHGEGRDIFERLYAVRLDRIRGSEECREVLKGLDSRGLLTSSHGAGEIVSLEQPSDEELLSTLGDESSTASDVSELVHVRSREEIKAAEEIAQRNPCQDFAKYKPMFEEVQSELDAGERRAVKYQNNAEVKKGDLFILDGQKLIVADMGEKFVSDYGRPDRRLRVVYDNGTESDLLIRSLQRALNKDKASRRITEPGFGPLFADHEEEGDLATGYVYVLRSQSDHPFVVEHRDVIHKIGISSGKPESRVAGAKKDPTYLLADVDIVETYKLANINRKKLESLLHKFFAAVRLDLELKDRFGGQVEPREWFLVSFPVIDEAIQRIMDGTIGDYRYDPATARLVPAGR